ncbi:MAG: nucleotidyl transferase AbiEii/AbiGii toxin family protein [Flavipsychrobacter sp.]|nr:nucleotidyl transferase AbiEii/AbiGii toxin family protein [Flavipsychrobacter sp.]
MGLNDKQPRRATKDVDFAILISDTKAFYELKTYFTKEEGFDQYHGNAFVMLWKDGTQVDLLPFGEIEDNGVVHVEGTGHTSINVDGLREVYEEGLPELELETGNKFKFCTLPGIVLLKLIAWDDRPEMRVKDILDISDILNHYFEIHSDEIYNNHNDLFAEESAELIDIAATVLGSEIGEILKRNENIAARVIGILEANTTDADKSRIAELMTQYFENSIEENIALLKRIINGINSTLKQKPKPHR